MADRNEFGELDDFIDDSITLPGVPGRDGKKDYDVEAVDGADGIWAQRLLAEVERARESGDADAGKLDDGDERLLYQRMLGPVMDQMIADGVKWPRISHAAMTVYFWTTVGRDKAVAYWKSGGDPERLSPAGNRASRRASAAAERTTRKRASGSGTKAPKTSARKSKASPGKKS